MILPYTIFAGIVFILVQIRIFFFTPLEISQGWPHKIFFIHLPIALSMYLGFFLTFLFSLGYLKDRKARMDRLARSSAEVGYLFACLVLATGMIWAKPIWGAYWDWEPRLTSTFLLWLIYTAYFFLGNALAKHPSRALYQSLVGVIGFLNVPLIHFSVRIWRGIHPSVIRQEGGGMPESMKLTLLLSLLSFLMLFGLLLWHRIQAEHQQFKVGGSA